MFWPIYPLAFFRRFMLNLGVYTISNWTLYLTQRGRLLQDQVQVLSHNKCSLLFLLVVGIEPAISWWFHSEVPSNQTLYSLCHVFLLDNSEWIFGTYKPNVNFLFCFFLLEDATVIRDDYCADIAIKWSTYHSQMDFLYAI